MQSYMCWSVPTIGQTMYFFILIASAKVLGNIGSVTQVFSAKVFYKGLPEPCLVLKWVLLKLHIASKPFRPDHTEVPVTKTLE